MTTMLHRFLGGVGEYIHQSPWLAVVAVFLGGILTASSPCVLAMIPLAIGFVGGQREQKMGPLRAFLYSLMFVAGLGITFTALGATAALAGKLYGDISGIWNWLVAAVCVLMGLHLMGIVSLRFPSPVRAQPKTRGVIGAFVLGLLFGTISTPCATPILVVLLAYLAGSGASVAYGAALFMTFALGHSVLILLAGTSMGIAKKLIESKGFERATESIRRASGAMVVLVGVYFVYTGLR
jgi:cytochrome c-type biogenesis protein